MILLDTHVVIWLGLNPERISRSAILAIEELRNKKDPMDRIIGATAIVEGCALITADAVIQASKALATVW